MQLLHITERKGDKDEKIIRIVDTSGTILFEMSLSDWSKLIGRPRVITERA